MQEFSYQQYLGFRSPTPDRCRCLRGSGRFERGALAAHLWGLPSWRAPEQLGLRNAFAQLDGPLECPVEPAGANTSNKKMTCAMYPIPCGLSCIEGRKEAISATAAEPKVKAVLCHSPHEGSPKVGIMCTQGLLCSSFLGLLWFFGKGL